MYHCAADIGGALVKKEVGYIHVECIGKHGIGAVRLENVQIKSARWMLLTMMIGQCLLESNILERILITLVLACYGCQKKK